jgi:hypothetical protein
MDPFWYENKNILFNKYRVFNFIPMQNQSYAEKVNAITRFFIYFSIILCFIKQDVNYLVIALFGLLFTYFIYYNYEYKEGMTSIPTEPTKDNPFMNILVNEYSDNPTRGPAANIEDPKIKSEIDKNFNFNLYKDVNDIWDKNNSQRQYYTMPSTTIPNDRDSFAKWLYDTKYICKDGDLEMCGRGETLQINHHGKI